MPNFIFAYHGGKKPETPEAGAELMEKWHSWTMGLGDAMTNPGNPLGMSKTVSSTGVTNDGGTNPLSGFSIVEAMNIDAAIEMTNGCPHLDHGTIEVAEVMEM